MDIEKILDFAGKYGMLSRGDKVLCAVSGGADSVCMLHILLETSQKCGFQVEAAHFNHMLRGEESDRDESFVRRMCAGLNVPFYAGRGDVKSWAAERGMGLEEAARHLRYDFLLETAEKAGAGKIATAHTADDNAETVIMRLARGTGLKGLCGIPPVRGKLIRPILCMTRAQVEEYLRERGLEHVEDSTNSEDFCTRNRVRHFVMPVLKEINPGASEAVSFMTELLREDLSFLEGEAERFMAAFPGNKLPVKELLGLPEPVLKRVIIGKARENLNKVHVDRILLLLRGSDPSAEADVPGMRVRREYGWVIFGGGEKKTFSPVTLGIGEKAVIDGLDLEISVQEEKSGKIYNSLNTFFFNYDNICGKITVRPRKTGDAIKTPGGTKTLKKLFIEKKIPAAERERIPVIADSEKLLGVWRIAANPQCAPREHGRTVKITIKKKGLG